MRRNKVLLEDQETRGMRINSGLVGSVLEVLAEGPSLRNKSRWSGRSGTNKIVIFDPVDGIRRGDIVRVLIERAMPQTVYGRIVD
jgi:tRNA-2-methylthio-N6-dimethylallyladenosine synthase